MSFFHRFEIVGEIQNIEVIATGRGIRSLARLRRTYGRGPWRKLKGTARIQVDDGRIFEAELRWYEAHGIGKRLIKVKRWLDPKQR